VITLDTSGLFAYINRDDPYHDEAEAVLEADAGPWYVPAGILAEITYLLEQRGGFPLLRDFLQDLRDSAYEPDWDPVDLARVQRLTEKYRDLGLGYADAAVIATAERHQGKVLTTDRRHFLVVARGEKTITVLPETL
jgi:predicted nucleic acid-binding protein